jgi:hypothetical protein
MLALPTHSRGASTPPFAFDSLALANEASGLHVLRLGRQGEPAAEGSFAFASRGFAWLEEPNHALLTRDRHHRFFVYDTSRGGTYINDVRIPSRLPHQLAHGDVISLGAPLVLSHAEHSRLNPYVLRFHQLREPREALARGRKRPRSAAPDASAVMDALACPVCLAVVVNAHNIACGHTFCLSCITTWLSTHRSCPTCRAPALSSDMRLVRSLGSLSDAVLQLHGRPDDIAAYETRVAHERIGAAQSPPAPARAAGAPLPLTPESGNEDAVVFRARVNGGLHYFFVYREALDGF